MCQNIKDKIKILESVLDKVPEIRYAGDEILRQETIPAILDDALEIGERMELVLLKYREITNWGRGLAAPQIGENKSVFITYIDNQFELFINPKIIDKSNVTNFYKELCMSAGIMSADVERADWIIMEWTDKNGVINKERFDGFKARLYQHEEAHLRGRLNLDDAYSGGIGFATFDPLKEELRDEK